MVFYLFYLALYYVTFSFLKGELNTTFRRLRNVEDHKIRPQLFLLISTLTFVSLALSGLLLAIMYMDSKVSYTQHQVLMVIGVPLHTGVCLKIVLNYSRRRYTDVYDRMYGFKHTKEFRKHIAG